ncbi:MAG: metalloregulator ArsR/SmtB family transcription factor [Devosia sp.]
MANSSPPLDRVFQALADPTRREIVSRLAEGPQTVSDLAAPYSMALPTFLQHIKVLEGCGLIRTEKVGRVRTCHAEPEALGLAGGWIAEQRKIWEARLDRLEAHLTEEDDTDG